MTIGRSTSQHRWSRSRRAGACLRCAVDPGHGLRDHRLLCACPRGRPCGPPLRRWPVTRHPGCPAWGRPTSVVRAGFGAATSPILRPPTWSLFRAFFGYGARGVLSHCPTYLSVALGAGLTPLVAHCWNFAFATVRRESYCPPGLAYLCRLSAGHPLPAGIRPAAGPPHSGGPSGRVVTVATSGVLGIFGRAGSSSSWGLQICSIVPLDLPHLAVLWDDDVCMDSGCRFRDLLR